MAAIKAFRGLRPRPDLAEKVAELPYDVLSSDEARQVAEGNQYSFFHVTKPEIDMSLDINIYDESVYAAGKRNLDSFIHEGILIQDREPRLYLYTQIMNGRSQTGLVACVSIDDYIENRVKKHELTREDKEQDRTRHLDILNANCGPVFLLYREDGAKKKLFDQAISIKPIYDFTAEDGITHIVRVIENPELISGFEKAFSRDNLYIADGHHRAASAVRVGQNRRKENPAYTGEEEFNHFLAVIFPHDQLRILAYNRAVKDLNGMENDSFLQQVMKEFTVEKSSRKVPLGTCEFSMYLDGTWSTLKPRFTVSGDPIEGLDVKILQDHLLEPVLGIGDPRTDNRISFIGGIRGTEELEKLVDSGKYKVAFSLYPTTLIQLMNVSDTDGIMPPKSTWFEPKLRSGLVVHLLDK
ncbi:MAG: DUF1015 domain-containing protein [Spirochaetae bacterium HGW-Spirochaetae-1]|jgi:uncharacterized protein (DUF1015 family)|nr:MAG: DUF1015 domain-containing protein [Spirochaetae bacterium HGW-Spirochaetae-1]